jgi:two-component system response regulator FixJ
VDTSIRPLPHVLLVQERAGSVIEQLLRGMPAPLRRCASARTAIDCATTQPLSCVVTTLTLPDMSAKAMISALRRVAPGVAIIVLVDNPVVGEAAGVMKAGAHAVIDSRLIGTGLFHLLMQKAFRDQQQLERLTHAMAPVAMPATVPATRTQTRKRLATLTSRELQVLGLVTHGHANKAIAKQLGVSQRTVEIHRAHVMAKMHAASLAELVRMVLGADAATQNS